ncbi:MAG TPA: hypothetical protein VK463_06720 [Desulfomonilaceae bacterium]|nr:hypothetical protein [Desulfomonilaceae bacterium]
MIFDKVWVRIKGELLAIRDDVSGAQEFRDKARRLLQKLESRTQGLTNSEKQPSDAAKPLEQESSRSKDQEETSMDDLEREWEEFLRLREDRKKADEESDAPPPNPRSLG